MYRALQGNDLIPLQCKADVLATRQRELNLSNNSVTFYIK